ncbi:MAG: hydantoinase/oxoprolinase family protein [Chloroflexota bacterium]
MTKNRLAIDVGGTFVDFVLFDQETASIIIEKVPSSGHLEERFFEGQERLGSNLNDIETIVHGSTMVINTIVQETGAHIGLITTHGFRDVLELGRGNRVDVYDLFYKQPPPLVPRYLRYEVPERLSSRGEVLEPLNEDAARSAVLSLKEEGVAAIAICFLHAYVNDAHERRMAEIVAEVYPDTSVTISSSIVREWLEYERTSTAVLNAYTQPPMAAYLSALEAGLAERGYQGSFTVMQSSGGTTSSKIAQAAPIRTIQSGPAGGVIGAATLGRTIGQPNLVSADVGGTTFDVALIVDGNSLEQSRTALNRRPVLQPTIDIVSVGAGGGSIAWVDEDGGLQIGPRSAQAHPGPACFGLGGDEPTVTDAQVVLGYLDPNYYLGKRMVLDRTAAERAIDEKVAQPLGISLQEAARGIIHLTNMNMVLAIRQVTIERGHDPREFGLVCFGGGGALFAAALMAELEMPQAIIPVNPATFSAWGLLNADFREDLVRTGVQTMALLKPTELAAQFAEMEAEARTTLNANQVTDAQIHFERIAECRYTGQMHTVRVPVQESDFVDDDLASLKTRFDAQHELAYAHALPTHAGEMVALRLAARGQTPKPEMTRLADMTHTVEAATKGQRRVLFSDSTEAVDCPIFDRALLVSNMEIAGPAIIEEATSTTLVPLGLHVTIDVYGHLILRKISG